MGMLNGQWTMVNGRNSSNAFAAPVAADFDNSQFVIRRSSLPLLLSFHLATFSDSDTSPFNIDRVTFLMPRSSLSDPRYSSHSGNLFLAVHSYSTRGVHDRRISLNARCVIARYLQRPEGPAVRSIYNYMSREHMARMLRCGSASLPRKEQHT